MSGEFNAGKLHPIAEAKEGNLMRPCVGNGFNLPLSPPLPPSNGDDNPVYPGKKFIRIPCFNLLRADPLELHINRLLPCSMFDRFKQGCIRITEHELAARMEILS